MTNKPTTSTFNFNALIEGVQCNHSVRVVTLEGNPWFVASDCCLVLGLSLASGTTTILGPISGDEKRRVWKRDYPEIFCGGGTTPSYTLISERGLYQLLAKSTKPQAKPFQDWLFGEVLPSIRKTGGYQLGAGETMPLPTSFAEALRQHASGIRAWHERRPPTFHGRGGTGGNRAGLFIDGLSDFSAETKLFEHGAKASDAALGLSIQIRAK